MVADVDYIRESRASIEARIADLGRRASEAWAEARHAREHPGLDGPRRNAEVAAAELETEIASLREVAVRIDRGYAWWDRAGYELALEAYGEPWRWQSLSESLADGFVWSHDDVDVRLPVEIQRSYGRALESGLFRSFELCEWYETDGDFVTETRAFLFGVQEFPRLGSCLFLIDQWDG
jgi:hypothetical protein